jgi:capsular polysaccharide biosynthesis protein
MTRSDIAGLMGRHGPLVGVLTLAGLVAALAVVLLQLAGAPAHSATVGMVVPPSSSADVEALGQGAGAADPSRQPADPVVALVRTSTVLGPVIRRLGLPLTASRLASRISTSTAAGSLVLHVTVWDDSSPRAMAIADALADRLVTVAGARSLRLIQIQRAERTDGPSPDLLLLAGGPLLGLAAGLVVAGLREPRREPGWQRLAVRDHQRNSGIVRGC